jgi:HEPN domain-containing protein
MWQLKNKSLSHEKSFKSIYAYYGVSIPRTHALSILYNFVNEKMSIDEIDINDIITISDYYETDRYPRPRYVMPSRDEVEHFFLLAEKLHQQINVFINA